MHCHPMGLILTFEKCIGWFVLSHCKHPRLANWWSQNLDDFVSSKIFNVVFLAAQVDVKYYSPNMCSKWEVVVIEVVPEHYDWICHAEGMAREVVAITVAPKTLCSAHWSTKTECIDMFRTCCVESYSGRSTHLLAYVHTAPA